MVSLPLNERHPGLVYAPQVNEPALASDGYILRVLPLNLEALELWVYLRVIEASNLSTVTRLTIPDIDLTHEAAGSDQVVWLLAELTLHEILIEVLALIDVNFAFRVYFPYACNHVRWTGEELVACNIPMYRADSCVLIVLLCTAYMRNLA